MNIHQIDFVHPELAEGEVFFTNSKLSNFHKMKFNTKRIGKIAYDGLGNKLILADWYPVFLKKEELISSEITLMKLRRTITN